MAFLRNMESNKRLFLMIALKKLSAKKYGKRKARNFLMKNAVLHYRMQRARYFSSIMQTSLFSLFVRNRKIWAYSTQTQVKNRTARHTSLSFISYTISKEKSSEKKFVFVCITALHIK